MTCHMGEAWADRWRRRREAEKRAETPTLTVQQNCCRWLERIQRQIGVTACWTMEQVEARPQFLWQEEVILHWSALFCCAQANTVQSGLKAEEMWCSNPGEALTPTALKAEWGGHYGVASSLWRALMHKGCRSSSRSLGEGRAPWYVWADVSAPSSWSSDRQVALDYSYKNLNVSSYPTDALVQHALLSIHSVILMFFGNTSFARTLRWQFHLSWGMKKKDWTVFLCGVNVTIFEQKH